MNPIPFSMWEDQGNVWQNKNSWYNMVSPENLRDELVDAGVVSFVAGRWVIFPDAWQLYVKENHRPRVA